MLPRPKEELFMFLVPSGKSSPTPGSTFSRSRGREPIRWAVPEAARGFAVANVGRSRNGSEDRQRRGHDDDGGCTSIAIYVVVM
ncbi:hypothetical protein N7510_006730 [Penicillium lagena]|uniref:uncharacterized protein n=1 Tax=Penicillium lagena TaxID=94218 RepID=UPI002541EC3A|nr:uncharacterized protein N7510_006730 [Penicillium lagena]KAJ5610011.1 hypothetical protein N7510_006730 [Penicillium lagena]